MDQQEAQTLRILESSVDVLVAVTSSLGHAADSLRGVIMTDDGRRKPFTVEDLLFVMATTQVALIDSTQMQLAALLDQTTQALQAARDELGI